MTIQYLKNLNEKNKINIMEITTHSLEKEIAILTEKIRTKYPEVYRNIEEMPITIPDNVPNEMRIKELSKYLESLKTVICRYESC